MHPYKKLQNSGLIEWQFIGEKLTAQAICMLSLLKSNVYYFSYKLECRSEITPDNYRDL